MLRSADSGSSASIDRRRVARLLVGALIVALLLAGAVGFVFLTPHPIRVGRYAVLGPSTDFVDLGREFHFATASPPAGEIEWFQVRYPSQPPVNWELCWRWHGFICWRRR
jgi:hypothetical protein